MTGFMGMGMAASAGVSIDRQELSCEFLLTFSIL